MRLRAVRWMNPISWKQVARTAPGPAGDCTAGDVSDDCCFSNFFGVFVRSCVWEGGRLDWEE